MGRLREAALGLALLAWRARASFDGSRIGGSLLQVVEQAPCVRLFHSKGSAGCRTTTHEGVTAPLFLLESFSSADQEVVKGLKRDVAVVISSNILNGTVLSFLSSEPSVRAVVVLEDWDDSSPFSHNLSPDVKTPHGDGTPDAAYTIGSSYQWNGYGNGLAYQSHDMPIVLVTGESINNVRSWAQRNGQLGKMSYPLWTAQLDFYFGPSGSSVTSAKCLRWKDVDGNLVPQCMPMGGQSVWGSLGGRTGLKSKSSVLLTAAMDSTSLFHDKAPGANEAVSSIVVVLAAVDALSRSSSSLSSLDKNIAVALFQADEWGFAGSRRFAQDVSSFTCGKSVPAASSRDGSGSCLNPAAPSLAFQDLRLAHVLAIDQVGLSSSLTALTSSTQTTPSTLLSSLTSASTATTAVSYGTATTTAALPPSPLTSFLLSNSSLSGAVLAGYSTTFSDPRYHSHMDEWPFLNTTSLADVTTFVARAVYSAAGGADADLSGITANATLVKQLVACLTQDWHCEQLMRPLIKSETDGLFDYLGRSTYMPESASTPSFYSSIIASYQGLPLVQLRSTKRGGVSDLYASWDGDFDASRGDKVYVVPKPLEAFTRAFLASTISQADASSFRGGACKKAADCGDSTCDGGLSTFECVSGQCVCRTLAYYHTALDPGLKPSQTPDQFEVVDASSPNWAEPNWVTIGMSVWPDTSPEVENAAIAVGVVILAASTLAAHTFQSYLTKHNVFERSH